MPSVFVKGFCPIPKETHKKLMKIQLQYSLFMMKNAVVNRNKNSNMVSLLANL